VKSAFAVDSNFPDDVWIFDCSYSIDDVGSFCDLPDSVWLFPPSLQDSTGKMSVGPTTKMAVPRWLKLLMIDSTAGEFPPVPS
jgi:hypothetical protein